MNADEYKRLRVEARRWARRAADVDDLVQDALLIALEQGRDDPLWIAGVIRNRAAMQARAAIRRRRREIAANADVEAEVAGPSAPPSVDNLLARLPPAARRVAVLALHGLNAEEIRWVLGIAETAFRQRLTSIRKAMGALPPMQRAERRPPVRAGAPRAEGCAERPTRHRHPRCRRPPAALARACSHFARWRQRIGRNAIPLGAAIHSPTAMTHSRRTFMLNDAKVGAIVFFVGVLSRSVEFYRDTLGLPVNEIDGHDGPFALAELGDMTLVFIQRPAKAGDSPVVVFALDGGIDDYAEALATKGVEIVVPVSEAPDGGLSLDFVDPDRNMLSLYQPPGAARRQ
jgi:DNA-directed RNA polymerase specialized sigma24 family protein/predicted enzyme related to lactoylglutathione lyase